MKKGYGSFSGVLLFTFLVLIGVSCTRSEQEIKDPKIAKLKIPDGFHAEHLYSPKEHGQGSWVAMTFDNKGRMITSDQYGKLYRLDIPRVGYDTTKDSVVVKELPIKLTDTVYSKREHIGFAHGLLYAFNSLYVVVNDEGAPDSVSLPSGLYRLQDTDNDDVYDKMTLLKKLDGRGEHGPHNVVVGPDSSSLYLIAGNFTKIPEVNNYLIPATWKTDNLLPLLPDPRGFGVKLDPPGGWIARMSPDGDNWEVFSVGFRNPFDMAFNEDGELFTYDSDMEWDLGLPWYRPTRICHVTNGSEFGYRENDQKWNAEYIDNLPSILEIGQGSPTNMMSGHNANFPAKYRRGLFTFDWSFGIIYHVDLIPQGSSYTAKAEEFISGTPLPLTDGAIGPDGAMYFLTGGRKIESDLYRVYYGDNKKNTESLTENESPEVVQARKTRRDLEAFHGKQDPKAVDFSWPYLKNDDRFIRFAARIAIESQPVAGWQEKALAENDPVTLINAMLALARNGDKSLESKILEKLSSIDLNSLTQDQQRDLFRTIEVTISRMGMPSQDDGQKLIAKLGPLFPAKDVVQNRILSKVLVYIGDANIVSKLVPLLSDTTSQQQIQATASQSSDLILRNPQYGMDIADMLANMPPQQSIYYAVVLSSARAGWSENLRNDYFKWFYTAFDKYKGGRSFVGYINEARLDAINLLPKGKQPMYGAMSGDSLLTKSGRDLASNVPAPKGPGRYWDVEGAMKVVNEGMNGRNYEDGKNMFLAVSCGTCHRVGTIGEGDIGPDLTQLGTRFTYEDMLEAIIEPSKTISSQYASTVFFLKSGKTVVGRLIREENGNYVISQNPFNPEELRKIPKNEVTRTGTSEVSIMPPGLISRLNPDELKDLLAFLKAGGNENNEVFKEK